MILSRILGPSIGPALFAFTFALFLSFPGLAAARQATPMVDHDHGDAAAEPTGAPLTPEAIAELAGAFDDDPLIGGQVAPRHSKFVSPEVFVFLQFDNPDPAQATELRYVGVGVKGVYCAEALPDRSFTHFHRYEAADYAEAHGGEPGALGYWLSWVAVGNFEMRDGRAVAPGVDYEFSPTPPPPSCGADVPAADFSPAGAEALSPDEIAAMIALFGDPVLTGGQVPPRFSRWVNEEVFVFLQFDSGNPAEATTLRYIGIGERGTFCAEDQRTTDFTHYHRIDAAEYAEGHAGDPGETAGYWLLWVATDTFEARDGRQIVPGVDREFSSTPPPNCGGAEATPAAGSGAAPVALAVTASEWRFDPAELRVTAGAEVSLTVTNDGETVHTFTVPDLGVDTGPLDPGATTTLTFTAPTAGGHDFICTFAGHEEAGMLGRMRVE